MNLNKTNREEIMRAAVAAAFAKRDKAHEAERKAFADALYKHTHGAIVSKVMKLPTEWRAMHEDFDLKCDGFKTYSWRSEGAPRRFTMSKSQPFPIHDRDICIAADHPLYERAQAIADEYNAIERDKEALRDKLRILLHSVKTVAKLKAAWPEGAKFFPAEVAKAASSLPVPANLAGQINDLMGIRPSKARRT